MGFSKNPMVNDGHAGTIADLMTLQHLIGIQFKIPHAQDFTSHLAGATIFSKIDLVHAYHQIPVEESDIAKTAIITPFGLFEFCRMPFGLRNTAQTFQRFIDYICSDLDFVFVYLDDILVASRLHEEHLQHLRALFQQLADQGLVVNPAKCELGKLKWTSCATQSVQTVLVLIFLVSKQFELFQSPITIRHPSIGLWVLSTTTIALVPHCAEIIQPLHQALAARTFVWDDACKTAFEAVKRTYLTLRCWCDAVMHFHVTPSPQTVSSRFWNFGSSTK